ncbi:MAG: hypothetical protein F4X91_09115 [Nitrospinae bacterium]|nr:hypothetical protein [Nitrospinota bacterium]
MPFPFQEALSFSDHLLAGGFAFLFAVAVACVCGGSVFTLVSKFRASQSMDPRCDDLDLGCAKTTRALAAWAVCPLGLGLWVVMMARHPRMMEQLHSIFIAPALLGLLLFGLSFCFLHQYTASWGRDRHESRPRFAWGLVSATGFWCAAAVLVSICAFSAHTGAWAAQPGLWNAFWNPTFPAAFLTWAAVSISIFGAFGLLYALARKDSAWRVALVHELGKWVVAGAAVGVLGWIWWGISLPESPNQKLVFWLVAAAVGAQAALGGVAYRLGVREPEMWCRRHAVAASALVLFLMAACGWVYAEAKGNFLIHRYMYRNGMIIEEAEDSNQTGLWNIVNLGEPMPAQEELGAFSFRAQCMACHADWVKSQDPARFPRFRLKGDALRFLGEMRSKHPPYPLLAGAPDERRALAEYLETLITKSGRTLASRPAPTPVESKPVTRPAVISKTSPTDAEKSRENPEAGKPEMMEKGVAVPALPLPDAAQTPEKTQEAKVPEKEDRPIGSLAPPAAAQDAKESQAREPVDSAVSLTRSIDSQNMETSGEEKAVLITPSAPPSDAEDGAKAWDGRKPEEGEEVPPVSSSPPGEGQDAGSSPEAKMPPAKESAAASATPLNDVQNNNPEYGESVSAAPSGPPDDSQDAKKPEEKNSP